MKELNVHTKRTGGLQVLFQIAYPTISFPRKGGAVESVDKGIRREHIRLKRANRRGRQERT